ncbi:MAG TPA: response regulator transcription factor [Candidatus Alectryocaccomicrobium excrementavium]|uniref:Stage 0 sporulation protein A homolog n=1 Tax=Candidatus Alectryocaccomicrobium excrementavium TaxID=2840668 RepID=A0A9D1G2K2_9FIRM|nr:response regulator transcription factor [Candidatus Alectryocaccomicrobium excrementavium]
MAERILIVEDEEKLARFIELELLHEGYAVEKAADGRDGLEKAQAGGVDLVLLDVMLPGMSGMELLRRLRRASDVPVIMVTARDAVMDKVTGLDTGADDYITKPFEIEELLARIRAALRKRGGAAQGAEGLACGALTLDPARHTAAYGGTPIELTHREFTLLQMLMENQSIVLTRDQILEHVWGYDFMGETNVVDVYIRYLRAKIDDAFGVKLIHTVRGVGYVLRKPQ